MRKGQEVRRRVRNHGERNERKMMNEERTRGRGKGGESWRKE
jgi:hypothetical protein